MNEREFLTSRGWKESEKSGPWRWHNPRFGFPVSYYTQADAFSLEMSMLRTPKVYRRA